MVDRLASTHLISIKDPKGMLERAKAAWRQATQAWGKSLVERAELEKQRSVILGAKMEVKIRTEGSIDLTLGIKRSTLRKEYARGFFGMDRAGGMVFTTPDGKSIPV